MHVVTDSAHTQLRVEGRLDVHTLAEARDLVHAAIDMGCGDLVVDLADVEVADATVLGLLVGAHRRAQRADRRLVLHGVPPRLARLLLATRLHRVLHLEPSIDHEAALFVTA